MKITPKLTFPFGLADTASRTTRAFDQQKLVGEALLSNGMVDRGSVVDWVLDGTADGPHQTLCDALNDIAAGKPANQYTEWLEESVAHAATHADEIPTTIYFEPRIVWDGWLNPDPDFSFDLQRVEVAGVELSICRLHPVDIGILEDATRAWLETGEGQAWWNRELEAEHEI